MKSLTSKAILDRVRKIEKKYQRCTPIRNDVDDEDFLLEDEDLSIGRISAITTSKTVSKPQDKKITLFSTNKAVALTSTKKETLEASSVGNTDIDTDTRLQFCKSGILGNKCSYIDNVNDREGNLCSEIDDNVTADSNCHSDKYIGEQDSVSNGSYQSMVFSRGKYSESSFKTSLHLKFDEEIDEVLSVSASEKNESYISDNFHNLHFNVLLPIEPLVDGDCPSSQKDTSVQVLDVNELDKDCTTEVNASSIKTSSVLLAKDIYITNSYSHRSPVNSVLHDESIQKLNLDSHDFLNYNIIDAEILNKREQSVSDKSKVPEVVRETSNSSRFHVKSGISNSLPLVISENPIPEKNYNLPSNSSNTLSHLESLVNDESNQTSTIEEDINEENDLSECSEEIPEFSGHQNHSFERISNISSNSDINDQFQRSADLLCKNILQTEIDNVKEEGSLPCEEKLINLVRQTMTKDTVLGNINNKDDLENYSLVEQQNYLKEAKRNALNDVEVGEIEHKLCKNSLDNLLKIEVSSRKASKLKKTEKNVHSSKLIKSPKSIEINDAHHTQKYFSNKNFDKKEGSECDFEINFHEKLLKSKVKAECQLNYRKGHKKNDSTIVAATKQSIKNDSVIHKNTCDAFSQTDVFMLHENNEFRKKIETIIQSSFVYKPNFENYEIAPESILNTEKSSVFSPCERGFHWALKQQVELTKHFIQAEYNMYATCMTAIKELSANYKPTKIHKSKK